MQFKIEKIILILNDNEKREIEFHDGVNIISGKSQTGKSALIDIIDYCLFSSTCTIPQGIIYETVNLYCLVVWINNRRLILARKRYKDNENAGSNKIFLKEINESFDDSVINANFFESYKNDYISAKQFKAYQIKNILDITTESIPLDDINDTVLSFRSMTSFMFQHQNLMASKFALFYRLDTFTRVKQTQRDFKVFMNIENIQSIQIEEKLEKIKKRLKQIEKEEKFFNDKFEKLIDELRTDCISFYATLGRHEHKILEITSFSEESVLTYNGIIEDITTYALDSDIPRELNNIKQKRDSIYSKINELNLQLKDMEYYESELTQTKHDIDKKIDLTDQFSCPLCGKEHKNNLEKYTKAKEKIRMEIIEIESIPPQILKNKSKLEGELKNYQTQYKNYDSKYRTMKLKYKDIISEESKKEELLKIKTKISSQQQILRDFRKFNNKEKDDLLKEQSNLKLEKGTFDFKTNLKKVEVRISEYINEFIKNGLELEKGLGEPNLHFNLEEFSLKQNKILLSEMGSGSNWLSCHIALMFGLHKYVALNNSKIPSFIFFDQPSQVYFPSEKDLDSGKESDLTTVSNIFKKIIENVDTINSNENCKSKIQLFVTDHYSNTEAWFTKCIIKDGEWKDGKKLIPEKYENE